LLALMQQEQCHEIYFNAEYPFDELERDRAVAARLRSENFSIKRFHDRVILPPGSIRNGQGEPYKVFTAFKRKWLQTVSPLKLEPLGSALGSRAPGPHTVINDLTTIETNTNQFFAPYPSQNLSGLWPAGEAAAV